MVIGIQFPILIMIVNPQSSHSSPARRGLQSCHQQTSFYLSLVQYLLYIVLASESLEGAFWLMFYCLMWSFICPARHWPSIGLHLDWHDAVCRFMIFNPWINSFYTGKGLLEMNEVVLVKIGICDAEYAYNGSVQNCNSVYLLLLLLVNVK